MDALSLVRQDHRKVENLLERAERLEGDDEEERTVLLGQLRAALHHHVDSVESILYPIGRERAGQAEVDLAPLDHAIEQHRLISRLAGELAATDPGGEGLTAKLTVLTEQVRTHLDTEDSVLLTAIEDVIDDHSLIELGRRMEQRDRVIESRRELASVAPAAAGSPPPSVAWSPSARPSWPSSPAVAALRSRRPARAASAAADAPTLRRGGVAERPKAATLKVAGPERAPWVRIPPPPPCLPAISASVTTAGPHWVRSRFARAAIRVCSSRSARASSSEGNRCP